MPICSTRKGFTVEGRYWSASANIDNIQGLSEEGNPQTHSGTLRELQLQLIFDLSQLDYQVRSATKVCCRRPLPGSHFIALMLSVFFIWVFSPINVPFFLRKHSTQARIAFNQISVFNGKSHRCRTNLHDARKLTLAPKNIYSQVQ